MLDTIKSSIEISSLFTQGRRFSSPFLTLIVLESEHDREGRVAFVAGKKLGNAVWRNRAKRRMRAVCRALGGPWNGYDVIFLARSQVNQVSYSKVLTTCNELVVRVLAN